MNRYYSNHKLDYPSNKSKTRLRFTLSILSQYMGKVRCLFTWKEYAKQRDTESLVLIWGLALKLVEEFFKFVFFNINSRND